MQTRGRAGRVADDGTVTLRFPVSLRTEDDNRGNALTSADVTVDPTHAATDLGEMHVKITQAILESAGELRRVFGATPTGIDYTEVGGQEAGSDGGGWCQPGHLLQFR